MPILLAQTWVPSSGTLGATTHTTTGATTAQGSTFLLTVMCRDNTSTVPTVSDAAGNTWIHAGTFRDPAQSVTQHLFYASSTSPIAAVTHVMYGADGVSAPSATHTSTLREFTGVGSLTAAAPLATPSTTSGNPVNGATVTAVQPGSLVVDAVTAGGANRVLTPGAAWTFDRLVSMAQMYHWFSWHVTEAAGPVTPLWTMTSGSSSSYGHVTAVFSPAGTVPDPDPDPPPARVRQLLAPDGIWRPATTTLL